METEEITKLVDGIYKNILDKFNPGARQLINAGKAYLKALHGAAAASRLYVESINKLAKQAQQGTWGGSSDVGSALMQIVEVYKEIQAQQMNILKAFYVDLLVPLETNLEKDTKVVQSEQKRFLQQHKQRSETYSKAAANMKKQRKKNKGATKTGLAMDKELKNMQVLEEEKSKLDAFCEQSLKTAMTQERRRYGFVLERQCSLAKHYLAYHNQGSALLQRRLDEWNDVAQTREYLPENVEAIFNSRLRQVSFWPDEDVYSSPRSPNVEDDRLSIASQLRKTKSMDASCLDMRSINDATSPLKPLSRAKSEFNISASTHSLAQDPDTPTRPKSMAVPERGGWESPLARALYAYLSSGDNQLSFLEGDIIALLGERNKGWQFGENLRTQCSGWFPLAYTEIIMDDGISSPTHHRVQSMDSTGSTTPATPTGHAGVTSPTGGGGNWASPVDRGHSGKPGNLPAATASAASASSAAVTMFGDTLVHRSTYAKQARHGMRTCASAGPPPALPAPVPTPKVPAGLPSHPQTLPAARSSSDRRLAHPPPMPPLPNLLGGAKRAPGAIGNASLHSSNDSGFSNDPPPAPEVDYSDDDTSRKQPAGSPQPAAGSPDQDKHKKQLLSSVRGWLLYKSAVDLWDDVNSQYHGRPGGRPVVRQASSLGHLVTSSRAGKDKAAPPQGPAPARPGVAADEVEDDVGSVRGVKRSRSLWRFKRSHKDSIVMEGMSLWRHRSLVDVNSAVRDEPKKKSRPATPVMKVQLSAAKIEPQLVSSVDDSEGEGRPQSPMSPAADGQDDAPEGRTAREDTPRRFKRTRKDILKECARSLDVNDDGLVSGDDDNADDFGDSSDEDTTLADNETDSCIVVDDHTHSTLQRQQQQQQLQMQNGSLLPRTKLRHSPSKERGGKDEDEDGLLQYGESLRSRMKKPDRGSRFERRSQDTGNMYGPWYDLWPSDESFKGRRRKT
ncbi:uncharacterized protein LOC134532068 isoform X2 [Bacillus rossius redtenbacheri]|uniref:uncharacterized protein LOC134532068 isoform X2 n=1 Tax=Bacillus rossius redtenbacheri TaxID=93214 RepID=UPI002FDDD094